MFERGDRTLSAADGRRVVSESHHCIAVPNQFCDQSYFDTLGLKGTVERLETLTSVKELTRHLSG